MYSNFRAEWTGSYPCLCSGEWILTAETTEYDEVRGAYSVTEDISHLIPEDLRKSSMGCEGIYDTCTRYDKGLNRRFKRDEIKNYIPGSIMGREDGSELLAQFENLDDAKDVEDIDYSKATRIELVEKF